MSKTKGKKGKKREARPLRIVGLLVVIAAVIAAIVFMGFVFWLNMVPTKYIVALIVVLLLLSAATIFSQYVRYVWMRWAGRILAALLIIILIVGDVYIYNTKSTISSISGQKEQLDIISVYVLKDDKAQTLADARSYKFGYHTTLDRTNTNSYIASINSQLGTTISTANYDDLDAMINALYKGEIKALILNQAYVPTISEHDPDFVSKTRAIANEYYSTIIEAPKITKNTLTDTFTVYFSGNDECGELNQKGRSDVNILMVINPKTKQVLLINTPRDYYVDVYSLTSGTGKDKLTHAGNFGINASMKTMSELYGKWDIDYYVRLNFTTTEEIIDLIGGVEVNSQYEFTTTPDTSDVVYHFTKGINTCDGKKALAFCRERQAVGMGDGQRGNNQMAVIEAVINRLSSPTFLYNYSSLLNSAKSLFQTSLSDDDIASMVKLTLEGEPWNIQMYAVSGEGQFLPSYFYSYDSVWMNVPDYSTVEVAKSMMKKIKDGEIFNVDEYVSGK